MSGWKRSWFRLWVVVRGNFLYCYEDEDVSKPHRDIISLKYEFFITFCCSCFLPSRDSVTEVLVHHTRKFCFTISHDERRPVCFEAADDEEKYGE